MIKFVKKYSIISMIIILSIIMLIISLNKCCEKCKVTGIINIKIDENLVRLAMYKNGTKKAYIDENKSCFYFINNDGEECVLFNNAVLSYISKLYDEKRLEERLKDFEF